MSMYKDNNNHNRLYKNPGRNRTKKTAPIPRDYEFNDFLSDVGNIEVQKLFGEGSAKAKLKVGDPGDQAEKDADRIADAVVKQEPSATADSMKHTTQNPANTSDSNKQLPKTLRDYFEPRFGTDLGNVRVHTDQNANWLSAAIHARAFALGNDIAFAKGEYKPETMDGKKLIAHEIAHVLQGDSGTARKKEAGESESPDTKNKTDEERIDEKLKTEYQLNELNIEEFLRNKAFDTPGSFEIAYDLYKKKLIELDALFDSEKIHAGKIRNFDYPRDIALIKLMLFSEYLKDEIADAESIMSGYVMDQSFKAYDHRIHFIRRIAENRTKDIGGEIGQVLMLKERLAEALKQDVFLHDNPAGQYQSLFRSLKKNGTVSSNILDPYTFGGGTKRRKECALSRKKAADFVMKNKDAYMQRMIRNDAEYICYDPETLLADKDTATVYAMFRPTMDEKPVDTWEGGSPATTGMYAMREGTALLPIQNMSAYEWIELRDNFYALQNLEKIYAYMKADYVRKFIMYTKRRDITSADIIEERNRHDSRLRKIADDIESLKEKAADNVITYCNFNYAVYNVMYTGKTMFQDGRGFPEWMRKLANGSYDDRSGKYVQVTEAYAAYWAANNGLAFGIEPTHVAPIVGYERVKGELLAFYNNVGQNLGYKGAGGNEKGYSGAQSFGNSKLPNVKYYIYVPN